MSRITVVVPVYNVEDYLDWCLGSLEGQTLKDIDIICVNDGSTDGSLAILREFESSYPFIRVIDQPNAGVSAARKAGLALAQGKYVTFVDSDDSVATTYLEELYTAAEKNQADIACCNYFFFYGTF